MKTSFQCTVCRMKIFDNGDHDSFCTRAQPSGIIQVDNLTWKDPKMATKTEQQLLDDIEDAEEISNASKGLSKLLALWVSTGLVWIAGSAVAGFLLIGPWALIPGLLGVFVTFTAFVLLLMQAWGDVYEDAGDDLSSHHYRIFTKTSPGAKLKKARRAYRDFVAAGVK